MSQVRFLASTLKKGTTMTSQAGAGLPFVNRGKEGAREDTYITTCLRCRFGIFKTHEYEWSRGDGLVHINCDDPRLDNAKV